MPKFGKYRIKNQLSCLIFENPALIPIQMYMQKFSKYWIKNQLSCLIFENPALIPIQM